LPVTKRIDVMVWITRSKVIFLTYAPQNWRGFCSNGANPLATSQTVPWFF
jgi:hypothetical protein